MTLIPCDLIAYQLDVKLADLREWARHGQLTAACDLRTHCLLYDPVEAAHAERDQRIRAARHAITRFKAQCLAEGA